MDVGQCGMWDMWVKVGCEIGSKWDMWDMEMMGMMA